MNERQKAFADYYIECGNATEAARKAGYREKSAYSIGAENLKKPEISAYIARRLAEQDADRVASADEVLQFYTSVMRGAECSVSDRLKAADALMKRIDVAEKTDDPLMRYLETMRNC